MVNDSISSIPAWLRELYPFAQNGHALDGGIQMNFVDHGEGDPVLLLHGNPTWSFFYRETIKEITGQGLRCIAPDHVGCGLSDKPQAYGYTLRQHIDNMSSLVDALKLESFHLIVHDWGGAIGCGLAVQDPSRIKSLTLLNTAAFRFSRIPLRIALCKTPILGEILIRQFNAFAAGATSMASAKTLPFIIKRGFIYPYSDWNSRIATARFVQDIPMKSSHPSWGTLCDIEQKLSSLANMPIHLCWGMKDWCFCPAVLEHWKQLFPKAKLTEFPEASHYLLEDAGQQAIQAISGFVGTVK